MNEECGERIDRWLAAARSDLLQQHPDSHAQHRALMRFRERNALAAMAASREVAPLPRVRRRSAWHLWLGVPLAAAAGLLLLLGALALVPGEQPIWEARATPFIALASAEQLQAASDAMVLSSLVPRTALAEFGLPVDPARADQPIEAEFLLSRAGVLLAVRFKE